MHQINNAIARSNDIAPDEAKQAAAQTLERIIDQELLVQKALKRQQAKPIIERYVQKRYSRAPRRRSRNCVSKRRSSTLANSRERAQPPSSGAAAGGAVDARHESIRKTLPA